MNRLKIGPSIGANDDQRRGELNPSLASGGPALEKRQDILIEAVPGARRMAALTDPKVQSPEQLGGLQGAARAHHIELSIHSVTRTEEIAPAIDAAKASGAAALNVLATPLVFANRQILVERTQELRLPAVYQWPEIAEEGGLMAYGPRIVEIFRQLGRQLAKVLQGANPADLPVEQPTSFELVINLRSAKAIGHQHY